MQHTGMNLTRYQICGRCKLPGGRSALLQKAVNQMEPLPYCVYIGANGHYFATEQNMLDYLKERKCRNLCMQPETATRKP